MKANGSIFRISVFVISILTVLPFAICCDDEEGESLGAPQVEPPVTRNMPSGLTADASLTGDYSMEGFVESIDADGAALASVMMAQIKDYLYPTGDAVSPIKRMRSIDERMASLERRALDGPRACMENASTEWTLPAAIPSGESYPMYLQCQEMLNATAYLAFGSNAGMFYLVEQLGTSADEGNTVLAQVRSDGTQANSWTFGYQANPSGFSTGPTLSMMHVKAANDNGVEVTTAGTSTASYELSCGVHIKSNDDYVYVSGQLSLGGNCTTASTYCFVASSLAETALSDCTGASLDVFELTTLTQAMADDALASGDILQIFDTKVSGYTDFNKEP